MSDRGFEPHFGYIEPPNRVHELLYGIAGHELWFAVPATVETVIPTPLDLRTAYDQNGWNGCVGASGAQHFAIYNTPAGQPARRYDWRRLWCRCCEIDGNPQTDCVANTGTYLRTAFDVIRNEGLSVLLPDGTWSEPRIEEGCTENRWLGDSSAVVDEARAAIAAGLPIGCGSGWFDGMSDPRQLANGEWMMAEPGGFGSRQGGHAYLVIGASDAREAFLVPNSWGNWCAPIGAWLPYRSFEWLQTLGGGEAGVVTDRVDPPPEPPPPPEPEPRDCQGRGRRCKRKPNCCPGLVCAESRSRDRKTCR